MVQSSRSVEIAHMLTDGAADLPSSTDAASLFLRIPQWDSDASIVPLSGEL